MSLGDEFVKSCQNLGKILRDAPVPCEVVQCLARSSDPCQVSEQPSSSNRKKMIFFVAKTRKYHYKMCTVSDCEHVRCPRLPYFTLRSVSVRHVLRQPKNNFLHFWTEFSNKNLSHVGSFVNALSLLDRIFFLLLINTIFNTSLVLRLETS